MTLSNKSRLSYISSLVFMVISSANATDYCETYEPKIDKTQSRTTTISKHPIERAKKRKIQGQHQNILSVPPFLLDNNSARAMRNVDLQNVMKYPNLIRYGVSDPNLRKLMDRISTASILQHPDQTLFLPLPIESHISMDRLKRIKQDTDHSSTREESPEAAGILLWSIHNGTPVILIGERNDGKGWCSMGGSCDASDVFPYVTAARETMEETMKIFSFPPELVALMPYHDTKLSESGTCFRTYISNCIMVPESKFNEMLEEAEGHSKEYRQFRWVPITDLIQIARHQNETISSESQQTTTSSSSASVAYLNLTNDFVETLMQRPILNMLIDIVEKKSTERNAAVEEALSLKEKEISTPHQTITDQTLLPFSLFDRVAYQTIQKQRKSVQELADSRQVQEIDDEKALSTTANSIGKTHSWDSAPSRAFLRLILGKKMYVEGDDIQNLRNFIKLFYPESKSSKNNPFWRKGFEKGLHVLANFLNFEEQEYKKGNLIGYHAFKGKFFLFYQYISAINSILTDRNISNSSLGLRNNQMAFINPQTGKPFASIDEIFSLHAQADKKNDAHYGKEHETLILFVNNILFLGTYLCSESSTSSLALFFEDESCGFDSFENWMIETLILLGMSPAYATQCVNELNSIYTQFFGIQKDNGAMLAVSVPQSLSQTHTFLGDIDDTRTTSKSVSEMYTNILEECRKNEEELTQIDMELQEIEKKLKGETPHPNETDEELRQLAEIKLKEKEEKSGNFLERDTKYRERIKGLTIEGRIYLDPMQNFEIMGNWHYPLSPQNQLFWNNMLKSLVNVHALRLLRSNSQGINNVFITPNTSKLLQTQFQRNYALQLARPLNISPIGSDVFGYLINHEFRDVITELLQTRQLVLDITNPTFHNNFLKSVIWDRQFNLIGWLENLKEYIPNFNWDTLITDEDREYVIALFLNNPSEFYSKLFEAFHESDSIKIEDIQALGSLFGKNFDFRPLIEDGLKEHLKYQGDGTISPDVETAIRVLYAEELKSTPSAEQAEFIKTKVKKYLPPETVSRIEQEEGILESATSSETFKSEEEVPQIEEEEKEEDATSFHETSEIEEEGDDFEESFEDYVKIAELLKNLHQESQKKFHNLVKKVDLFNVVLNRDPEFELLNIPEIREAMKNQLIDPYFYSVLSALENPEYYDSDKITEITNRSFGSVQNLFQTLAEQDDGSMKYANAFNNLISFILNNKLIYENIIKEYPYILPKLKEHLLFHDYSIFNALSDPIHSENAQYLLENTFGSLENFCDAVIKVQNFDQFATNILNTRNIQITKFILKNPEISEKFKQYLINNPYHFLNFLRAANDLNEFIYAQRLMEHVFGSFENFITSSQQNPNFIGELIELVLESQNKIWVSSILKNPEISEQLKNRFTTSPINLLYSLFNQHSNNAQLIIQELFGSIEHFYQVIKEQSPEWDLVQCILEAPNEELAEIMLSDQKISKKLRNYLIKNPQILENKLQELSPFETEETIESTVPTEEHFSSSSSSALVSERQSPAINNAQTLLLKLFGSKDEFKKQISLYKEAKQFIEEKYYNCPLDDERAINLIDLYQSDREKFYTIFSTNSEFVHISTTLAYSFQSLFDLISKDIEIWNTILECIQSDTINYIMDYSSQNSALFAQKLYEDLGAEKFNNILKENHMLSQGLIKTLLESQEIFPWIQEVTRNPELMKFIRTKLFQQDAIKDIWYSTSNLTLLKQLFGNTKEEFVEILKSSNITSQNLVSLISAEALQRKQPEYLKAALADSEIWEQIKKYILQFPQEELSDWMYREEIIEKLYNESREEFHQVLELPDIVNGIKHSALYSNNKSFLDKIFRDTIFLSKISHFKNAIDFVHFLRTCSENSNLSNLEAVREFLISQVLDSKIGNLNITFRWWLSKHYEINSSECNEAYLRWLGII